VGYGAVEGPSGTGGARLAAELADAEAGAEEAPLALQAGCPSPAPRRGGWTKVVQQGKRLSDAAVAALPAFACDGPPEPEWHANGTIVGLLIDVGGTSGYYMFLILTMFFGLEANKDELLACHIGTGRMQLATWPQACLCEYTKAHLLIFPTLALSVVLVFMGRDLLQKRLYYGLLRSGGVVDFSQNKAFKDSLVLLFIVNYLHVVSHLALMYWVARPAYSHTEDDPSVAAPGFLRHQADAMRRNLALESGNLHALGFLWGTVMIPGTLVVVFVFLGYEIEKSLVPLSLYVHGLNDSQAPEAALQGLSVFRDASAKAVIEDPSGPVAAASGSDLDTQYRAVVDAASQVPPSQDFEGPSIGLREALWPVALLLRSNTPDRDARTFRWLWLALASASISMMVFGTLTLGPQLVHDLGRAQREGRGQVYAQVPVLACGILLVCSAVRQFAETFFSYRPVKRKSACEGQETPIDAFSTAREAPAAASASGAECPKTK